MSRWALDDEDRGTEDVIGWDNDEQPAAGAGVVDPGVRFWSGGGDRSWATPDALSLKRP